MRSGRHVILCNIRLCKRDSPAPSISQKLLAAPMFLIYNIWAHLEFGYTSVGEVVVKKMWFGRFNGTLDRLSGIL
jgi:hypothetical protein